MQGVYLHHEDAYFPGFQFLEFKDGSFYLILTIPLSPLKGQMGNQWRCLVCSLGIYLRLFRASN